ncbi:MAG: hypothetical protein AAFX99_14670 [Myxococcota bacterium]
MSANHTQPCFPLRRDTVCLVVCLAVAVSAGCTLESRTGLINPEDVDVRRDYAMAVYLNDFTSDQVDSQAGDTVDWKFVDVREPGSLIVQVSVDTPNTVQGKLTLRDNFATVLQVREVKTDRNVYTFRTVPITTKGRYYIQFECFGGRSVYTVATRFLPLQVATPTMGGNRGFTRTDPDPPRRSWRRSKSKSKPKPKDKTETPVTGTPVEDGPKPVDELPNEPGMTEVVGSILRVTALDNGGSSVVISLQGDGSDKVKATTPGLITGIKKGVVVRSRTGDVVTAFTEAQAETIKTQKTVIFRVK